jgi:hypothetical protein
VGEDAVDFAAVLAGQEHRFFRDGQCPGFAGNAGAQRGQRAGQFGGKDDRPADVTAGLGRGDPPRQRHRGGDTAPDPLARHAGGCLRAALGADEGGGDRLSPPRLRS